MSRDLIIAEAYGRRGRDRRFARQVQQGKCRQNPFAPVPGRLFRPRRNRSGRRAPVQTYPVPSQLVPAPQFPSAAARWWRLFTLQKKPSAIMENIEMLNPTLPFAIFDLIRRAVEAAAERPEVDIPADRKEVIAAQVLREARKLSEVHEIERAVVPKSNGSRKA